MWAKHIAFAIGILVLGFALCVLLAVGLSHAYTGIQWTMPTTNAKAGPSGCDSLGTTIPATEYMRWTIYRTAPFAPLVLIDSLGTGTALPGAAVTRAWGQLKPVPIPGQHCFVVVVADSLGNKCPVKSSTIPIAFTALDLEAPAPLRLIGTMP